MHSWPALSLTKLTLFGCIMGFPGHMINCYHFPTLFVQTEGPMWPKCFVWVMLCHVLNTFYFVYFISSNILQQIMCNSKVFIFQHQQNHHVDMHLPWQQSCIWYFFSLYYGTVEMDFYILLNTTLGIYHFEYFGFLYPLEIFLPYFLMDILTSLFSARGFLHSAVRTPHPTTRPLRISILKVALTATCLYKYPLHLLVSTRYL